MVQGQWFPMGSDLTQPLSVREAVFGRGRDALDESAQQIVVYNGDIAVGSARLWWQDGAFWLGEVGVLPAWRGMGYGDLLVRLLLYKALTHSARALRLKTPEATAGFFARYGFRAQSGEVMYLAADDVCLSHCEGCPASR